jgi:type II secretory pathway pseudopilin PulG
MKNEHPISNPPRRKFPTLIGNSISKFPSRHAKVYPPLAAPKATRAVNSNYLQLRFSVSPILRFIFALTLGRWTFRVRYWIFTPFKLWARPSLDTLSGSPSAQEIQGADQTVSVPGNAKRLLGLKNVRKDFRQANLVNNGGYTLLEMVIAVGIFTMVMLTASMGMVTIQKTWNSITLQNQGMRSLQVIDSVIDSAFRNAVPFAWTDENNKSRIVFSGNADRVVLAYQHRINNVDDGGIRFISLFLDNGCLVATYRKTPMLPWDGKTNSAQTDREILAEKIKSISFLYADRKKDDISWVSQWDENRANIPLAIQIKVEWLNGESEIWMRRTAGAGLRETYGVRVEIP